MNEKLNQVPLDVWIYDLEVFKEFWCATFLNVKTNELKTFKTGQNTQLKNFINSLKGAFVGGYNNAHYDDYILIELLNNLNPFRLSQYLINGGKGWEWESTKKRYLPFFSFDVIQLLGPARLSLKKYEAFCGLAIKETDIPFDKPEALTEQEQNQVIDYNIYDVKATVYLFIKFIDQFLIKINLISAYELPTSALKKTMTQIAALIFNAKSELVPFYNNFYYETPENIKRLYKQYLSEYYWLIEAIEKTQFKTQHNPEFEKEQLNFQIKHKDLVYEFKTGGLHAAKQIIIDTKSKLINRDIFSNYPHLIKYYNFGSRRAPGMEKKIAEFLEQRKEAKKQKDTIRADYLKALVVQPFGAMDYKFSTLWDAKQRMAICLTGELILFFLAVMISKVAEVLQVNTDGILYRVETDEQEAIIEKICQKWEKETLMTLEKDEFERLWQKDVNNYILVNDSKNIIKTKGAMVKYWNKQFHNPSFKDVRGAANNNLTVVDKAVVNYFVYNIDPHKTITQETDAVCFQFIFDVKGNYKAVFLGDKQIPKRNTYRLFYTKTGQPIFKAKQDEQGNWKKEKVPLSSERCLVYNGDIRNIKVEQLNLDYDYYIRLAWDRIEQYRNKDKDTKKLSNETRYPGSAFECGMCSKSLMDELVVRTIFDNLEVCRDCYFKKGDNK